MNLENLTALVENNLANSPVELKKFQQEELAALKVSGISSPVLESYKYTNLEKYLGDLTASDKFHNVSDAFAFNADIPGVKVKTLKDHFHEVKDLFKTKNALSHLHHGLMNEGLIIEIDKNQAIEKPITITHKLNEFGVTSPTIIVKAARFSKVCIIEETTGSTAAVAIKETYIFADEGAQIEHIQVEQNSAETVSHDSVFADVERDATVRSFFFNTAGKMIRKNLELNLKHPGAHGATYSLFLTEGTEHSDINTVIHHLAEDTTSDQMCKGILDGDSKGIFTGKIFIHPKAQRVASGQLNKNLLLSKKAQVHSQPQLEIFADDVKCSHGSTTGQLSDEEVFYLEARGIPADKARSLLAHGFGLEIVQKIENKEAKAFLNSIILNKLDTKFKLGELA